VQLKMKQVPEEWEWIPKSENTKVLQACEVPAVYMQA
jgi:hypothetical protein